MARANELGYAALAVTDRNSLAGVVRAHGAAKDAGLKLLIGAEITPTDAPPVVLLATDRAAYGRLSRLITRGRRNAEKGQCRLTFDDIANHAAGLLGAMGSLPALVAQASRLWFTGGTPVPRCTCLPANNAIFAVFVFGKKLAVSAVHFPHHVGRCKLVVFEVNADLKSPAA